MKLSVIFTSAILALSVMLASCQAPAPTKFDRQSNIDKKRTGGYNPGARNGFRF